MPKNEGFRAQIAENTAIFSQIPRNMPNFGHISVFFDDSRSIKISPKGLIL